MTETFAFEIPGEVPSKKNSRRLAMAGGRLRSFPSKAHERWHRTAMAEIAMQKAGRIGIPLGMRLRVDCTFYHADRRRRDHNNQMASVLDLLVDSGIVKDDSWDIVAEESCRGEFRKGNGGAKIEIRILSEVTDENCRDAAVADQAVREQPEEQ